jgi:hypothetical protein
MHNGDAARLGRVLELDVTASLGDLSPAIGLEEADDVAAVH